MIDSTEPEHQPDRASRLYLYGAIPGAMGTLATVVHLRAPIVPAELQSPLINATLSCWLLAALCAVADRICARFDRRHDDLTSITEAHALASARDYRSAMKKLGAVHKRLESIEHQNKEMAQEIAHLRELTVETRPLTGPTPYS